MKPIKHQIQIPVGCVILRDALAYKEGDRITLRTENEVQGALRQPSIFEIDGYQRSEVSATKAVAAVEVCGEEPEEAPRVTPADLDKKRKRTKGPAKEKPSSPSVKASKSLDEWAGIKPKPDE